jgi:hypothetical protein
MSKAKAAARPAWAIGAAAALAHLAVFSAVVLFFHISLDAYTDKGDGASYKHVASAILGDRGAMDEYDSRVFPGYPLLIAITHECTRLSIAASALAVTFISAGFAATFAAFFFNDIRIALAVAFALPHAWINMSLAMSEAPMLAIVMLALLISRKNAAGAGILFGIAILIRPVVAFALIGLILEQIARAHASRGLIIAAIAAAIFLAADFFLGPITGGLFHHLHVYANSPRAYTGQMLTWPFHSIISMTLHGNVGIFRWIYIMLHVALCLGGCALLLNKNSSTDLFTFIWLSLNTLFVLCLGLGAGDWGFNHFPRFTIPALPALAWSWRSFLPRTAWMYIPVGAGLLVMAVFAIHATP